MFVPNTFKRWWSAMFGLTILRSYLASTVTYNNTAALADTALSVTVAAAGNYKIELYVNTTSNVRPLNLDFGGTATFTNVIGQWSDYVASSPNGLTGAGVTSLSTDYPAATVANQPDGVVKFEGTVEVNAGGTLLLRGAQTVADVSDTTILRGSTLTLTKLN